LGRDKKALSFTTTFGLLFHYLLYLHFSSYLCPCSMILQLEDGTVALLSKAIEEDGFEICTEGIPREKLVCERGAGSGE
jgi:hypothetical protein